MKKKLISIGAVLALAVTSSFALAQTRVVEDFTSGPQARWTYFADTVMGGVSSGSVSYAVEGDQSFARLQGRVSTENNGGFIQIRSSFAEKPSPQIQGIRLIMRGNSQPYYIHLRTQGTRLPWQYYQAEFMAKPGWSEVRLPLSAFERSSNFLRKSLRPEALRSLGIVAYGRNHDALLDVAEIGFY